MSALSSMATFDAEQRWIYTSYDGPPPGYEETDRCLGLDDHGQRVFRRTCGARVVVAAADWAVWVELHKTEPLTGGGTRITYPDGYSQELHPLPPLNVDTWTP